MSVTFEKDRLQELMKYKKADIILMYARTLSNLKEIVANLNLWKCKKCGCWSMQGHVCYKCGYDPSEMRL